MVISPLALILLILIVLALGGSGYGYYSGGAYANPIGILAAVLVVGFLLWLLFGGVFWATPPP
jgi:hypothetical protein